MDIAKSRNFLLSEIKVNNPPQLEDKIIYMINKFNRSLYTSTDQEVINLLNDFVPSGRTLYHFVKWVPELSLGDKKSLYNELKKYIK